jgi:hypothetical protein
VCASQYGPRFTTGLPHKVNGRLSPSGRTRAAGASQAEDAEVAYRTMAATPGGCQQGKWAQTAGMVRFPASPCGLRPR